MEQQMFGWVKHNGGERPVPEGTTVKWLLGTELKGKRPYYDASDVLNSDHDWNDIVAYKIIRDAAGNLVNADVKEDPVSLFRSAPDSGQGYGSPLPTIALNTMVPPLSGEELVSAGVDPRFAAASYGNDLMVSGYPYAAPAGDPHEMVTFHELPAPIPTEDLQPYSNVISLPVREMASVSAGPRAGDGPPVGMGAKSMMLPSDPSERKGIPIATGVLDYFPLAIAEVARVSKAGNDQHNPGQPLHWDRTKSLDHADCIPRHLIDRGSRDTDGMRHSAKLAWRALALLQTELELEQAAKSEARRA